MAAMLTAWLVLGVTGPAVADPPGVGGAAANPQPPPHWTVAAAEAGTVLGWQPPTPLPVGDAAVEFYAGDRWLGRPQSRPDGRSFTLTVGQLRPAELPALEARAAGRRVDLPRGALPDDTRRAPRSTATPPAEPPPFPENEVDPGTPGPYQTVTGEYELAQVPLPGHVAPVEILGVVVAPRGATGPRPLALFLHGMHSPCHGQPEETVKEWWPCPAGTKPAPNHRGYLQAQQLLASQGYVTVSIAANGVNAEYRTRDWGVQGRSSLIRLHLGRWAEWADTGRAGAPDIVRAAPPADLNQVLLVGHSRGGEGVNRAAIDSLNPPPAAEDGYAGPVRWTIRGTVLIGPTLFGHNPAPDVPSMTILPGCDGDVSDLQGQLYVDATRGVSRGAALHSAVYLAGANHNYFNTEWTPGPTTEKAWDDFFWEGDPVCSAGTAPGRLTAAEQQDAGATYIAAAARLFVAGDDRVRPLLDGSGVRAASAGRARVLSHALGAERTPLLLPDPSVTVTGAGARICEQVHPQPEVACAVEAGRTHFTAFSWRRSEPGRYTAELVWSAPDDPVTLRPAEPASVTGAQSLALRVIVPPNTTGTRLEVAVADTAGRRATLGEVRLDGLPGTEHTTSLWAQEVRVPLAAARAAGLNLDSVAALELVPRGGSGRAWLLDAWGWQPGTPAPRPEPLTRVDIGAMRVQEGDSGTRTYLLPITVSGTGTGQVRLFLLDPATGQETHPLVAVRGDMQTIEVPIEVTGNTTWGGDRHHLAAVKAVRGAVVGSPEGHVSVANDDPPPEVTATPVANAGRKG
jgi:hypothetical protein